jgi:hypothetical protein
MRMSRWVFIALAACHVTSTSEVTRYGAIERQRHAEGAIARKPALVLGDAGALRFVEPLECPTEELVAAHTTTEIATRPNLATFVVGVVATAAGGVLAVRGAFGDAGPATYAGIAGVAVGLPLAIGPFTGNHKELREGAAVTPVRRPGPSEPCGERPLAVTSATLQIAGREVYGTVDGDGVFSVSAFDLVDAFQPVIASAPYTAFIDGREGPRTIAGVLEGRALVERAPAFIANGRFDGKIEPLHAVPDIVARPPAAKLGDDFVRIVLGLENRGPGEAFGVRAAITASHPTLDGRILYIGRLGRGAQISTQIMIPISRGAADALRGTVVDIAVELRDAHGTAPTTPLHFRGVLQ